MRNLYKKLFHGSTRSLHHAGKGAGQNGKPGRMNFPGDPATVNFQESPELKSDDPVKNYQLDDYGIRFPDSRSKIPFIGLFM